MSKKSTNTVTTNSNSLGRGYFENADKQIEWPVNIDERYISVPENELQRAKEHLMVQHLCNNGFFIRSAIPSGERNRVFDPDIRLKMPAVKIAPDDSVFKTGDGFRVKSTGCELEIMHVEKVKIHLRYTNRSKSPIILSEEQLSKNLSFGLWERK